MPTSSGSPLQPASQGRRHLDAAAPPLSAAAREALLGALDDGWADPRRLYTEGRRARALLDGAREAVAGVLGARADEVSFAPSATLARQIGLRGLLHGRRRVGRGLVLSAVEHSALLQTGQWLEGQGGRAVVVGVDRRGRVDLEAWAREVAADGVAAACLQAANGEVGTRQPLGAAAQACRDAGVPLLVDAGAVLGRDRVPAGGDVVVADARSWAGPGVGVLVVRTGTRWRPDGPSDENEHGRVPGEVDVPAALAAAAGLLDAESRREARAVRQRALVDQLRAAAAAVPGTEVVGDPDDRLPHIVTFSSLFVDGEALVHELDRRGFAVASGSACTASTLEPSHVLAAMGVLTHGNLRITLPLDPVESDVEAFCATLPQVVAQVRAVLGADRL
ncbi:cysteine desulfurase family protein [Angustibacter sp. Root456]|uniref:cysteine desulfurase family protein n=1 Tax=Angustibacter sp. Root456 TaxID=1736539 RepID=UPI0019101861|nr:aminotransferase class V-fold PLP-dependent enzyme [Angustibacter sp. Root456]